MSRPIPTHDRISVLPDPILCHILSFLSTKFAAITSILSKRWNKLWLSVLTLDLEDENFQNFTTFCDLVSFVFLSRDITLPLQSFRLKCSKASSLHSHDIYQFVYAAAQRGGIENINLEISIRVIFNLPPCIFSCKTLVVLHLKGLKVNDLSQVVVNFPFLKTLHLSCLLFELVEDLLNFLLGCPVLEELKAESLHINSSQWIVSQVEFVLREKMQSLPKFIRANITKIRPRYLLFLITWFCMKEAQVLRVELDATLCGYYHRPRIQNLTNMELILKHNHCEKWKWLVEILECCPKLQNLTIHEDYRNAEVVVYNWMDPVVVPKCLSTQLRTCLLNDHESTESGLQFAKYIIQNSKVLNTMTIKSASSRNRKAKYQMLLKLVSLPRASATCKFVFD